MTLPHCRVLDYCIVFLSGLMLLALFVCGYFMFLDGATINPVVILDKDTKITDKEVYSAGEPVYIHLELYKNRDICGTLQWNLINSRIFPFSPRKVTMPAGSFEKWALIEILPSDLETGQYSFEGLVTYRVNPLREINIPLRTRTFRVNAKTHTPAITTQPQEERS